MMSVSVEDFLKTIFKIRFDEHENAGGSEIARRLNITKSAVTDMAKKLAKEGLVIYKPYKEIELTEKGKAKALSVIRRHRLWELFLQKVLNLKLDEVHHEAEMLEHQTSDFLIQKIDDFLGKPSFDPHGDPIPDKHGIMPEHKNSIVLSDAKVGNSYEICRISHSSDQLSGFFKEQGITLNKVIEIKQVFKDQESIALEIGSNKLVLNKKMTENIHVIKK